MGRFHSSDRRTANRMWAQLGGIVVPVRRTGEVRYHHQDFPNPLTVNGRRHDVPVVVLNRINQLLKK